MEEEGVEEEEEEEHRRTAWGVQRVIRRLQVACPQGVEG
jgi:hypothetical protein